MAEADICSSITRSDGTEIKGKDREHYRYIRQGGRNMFTAIVAGGMFALIVGAPIVIGILGAIDPLG